MIHVEHGLVVDFEQIVAHLRRKMVVLVTDRIFMKECFIALAAYYCLELDLEG